MLTLAIGDLFVPDRSIGMPKKFQKLLCPNPNSFPTNSKINNVICLGNITSSFETLNFLNNLSPSLQLVKGEYDDNKLLSEYLTSLGHKDYKLTDQKIISTGGLKIGFTSGSLIVPRNDPLALLTLAREMDVDILIWGGTHKVEAYTLQGKFFINPGSATGAFNYDWPEVPDLKEVDNKDKKIADAAAIDANENKNSKEIIVEEEDSKQVQNKEADKDTQTDGIDETEGNVSEDANNNKIINEITSVSEFIPSFCLLDSHDTTCTLYIYTHFNNEVKVDKITYQKD